MGETKPLGYLPIETLVKICGVNSEDMKVELEEKGLVVLILSQEETRVYSGALFAYSYEALDRVLQRGKEILERNGWPTEPNKFIHHLKVFAEDPALYHLVMQTFADPRLQKE